MAYHLPLTRNRSLGEWSKARHCEIGEIELSGPRSNPVGGDLLCGGTWTCWFAFFNYTHTYIFLIAWYCIFQLSKYIYLYFLLKLRKKITSTANIFYGKICGDFPVNSKQIIYKTYMLFPCNIYLCTCSEKLWVLQATCNPCHNYVHVTGYPLLHGDLLHFLWGKHLQCKTLMS